MISKGLCEIKEFISDLYIKFTRVGLVHFNAIMSHVFWWPRGSGSPWSYMGHWVVGRPWGSARQCDVERL